MVITKNKQYEPNGEYEVQSDDPFDDPFPFTKSNSSINVPSLLEVTPARQ